MSEERILTARTPEEAQALANSTGCVVAPKNVDALRSTIVQLLQSPQKLKKLALTCRKIAIQDYSLKIQAKRYLELYKRILEKAKAK